MVSPQATACQLFSFVLNFSSFFVGWGPSGLLAAAGAWPCTVRTAGATGNVFDVATLAQAPQQELEALAQCLSVSGKTGPFVRVISSFIPATHMVTQSGVRALVVSGAALGGMFLGFYVQDAFKQWRIARIEERVATEVARRRELMGTKPPPLQPRGEMNGRGPSSI